MKNRQRYPVCDVTEKWIKLGGVKTLTTTSARKYNKQTKLLKAVKM